MAAAPYSQWWMLTELSTVTNHHPFFEYARTFISVHLPELLKVAQSEQRRFAAESVGR